MLSTKCLLFYSSVLAPSIIKMLCDSFCLLPSHRGRSVNEQSHKKKDWIIYMHESVSTDGVQGRERKGGLPVPPNSPGEQPQCSPPMYSGPVFDSRWVPPHTSLMSHESLILRAVFASAGLHNVQDVGWVILVVNFVAKSHGQTWLNAKLSICRL